MSRFLPPGRSLISFYFSIGWSLLKGHRRFEEQWSIPFPSSLTIIVAPCVLIVPLPFFFSVPTSSFLGLFGPSPFA